MPYKINQQHIAHYIKKNGKGTESKQLEKIIQSASLFELKTILKELTEYSKNHIVKNRMSHFLRETGIATAVGAASGFSVGLLELIMIQHLIVQFGQAVRQEENVSNAYTCYQAIKETLSMINKYPKECFLIAANPALKTAGMLGAAGAIYGLFSNPPTNIPKKVIAIEHLISLAHERISQLEQKAILPCSLTHS